MDSSASPAPVGFLTRFNLLWLHKLITSSIGRKLVMGATGLLLCGFLVGHLAGNMLLFKGSKPFNEYAHFLHSNEALPFIEAGLYLLFILHIWLAFSVTSDNWKARKRRYAMKVTKQTDLISPAPAHNWMFVSGAIVLGFLILHIIDLRAGVRPGIQYNDYTDDPFGITVRVLSDPISRVVYTIGAIILGFHVGHGFASAFQTLGLTHPKYNSIIKYGSILFGLVIAIGFASLPILVPSIAQVKEVHAAPSLPKPAPH